MGITPWIDQMPLVGVFVAAMVVVLLSIGGGFWLGTWRNQRSEAQGEGIIGSAVASMLGLLAFIVAFTFGMTASRYDLRRQLLLDEVNAIGTVALRAELLPESQCTQYRELLRSYVNLRANPDLSRAALQSRVAASAEILDQLWAETLTLAKVDMDSPLRALFVQSLNEMIDLHTSRVAVGLHYRIPGSVWLWLLGATVCAMFAVGYQSGFSRHKKVLIHLLLATLFSSVVLLITDLDRASEGTVTLDLQPMVELQHKLADSRQVVVPHR